MSESEKLFNILFGVSIAATVMHGILLVATIFSGGECVRYGNTVQYNPALKMATVVNTCLEYEDRSE